MRYFLAAILICAIGAPAAYALPTVSPGALSLSSGDAILKVAKRGASKPPAKKSKSSGGGSSDGGIHPLVGSGGY